MPTSFLQHDDCKIGSAFLHTLRERARLVLKLLADTSLARSTRAWRFQQAWMRCWCLLCTRAIQYIQIRESDRHPTTLTQPICQQCGAFALHKCDCSNKRGNYTESENDEHERGAWRSISKSQAHIIPMSGVGWWWEIQRLHHSKKIINKK